MIKTSSRIILILCLPFAALASGPTWLCTEESSQRRGEAIYSCGVGTGDDENEARQKAFDNAKTEFTKICSSSDDCRGHAISIQPQRTSCEQEDGNKRDTYKCYRLLVFTIGKSTGVGTYSTSPATTHSSIPILYDNPDNFQPFSYSQISRLPKVKVGMTKSDVVSLFGVPESISHLKMGMQVLNYQGKMCSDRSVDGHVAGKCSLLFDENVVNKIENFSFKYTEDLK